MTSLLELFCDVDDFCQDFYPQWEAQLLMEGSQKQRWQCRLRPSEIMTILIEFQRSNYRHFKGYYTQYVSVYLRNDFPALVSYNRFIQLMPRVVIPLAMYLHTRFERSVGIAFIDATSLAVCHNRRIEQHKVFKGIAQRGKTSMGWFYGFKLHIVINETGGLVGAMLSPGNLDDRKPVPQLTRHMTGLLFGDKGYLSQALFDQLMQRGLKLVTSVRRNMKQRLLSLTEKILLRKRALIESVHDQLKNIANIEHSRHRSPTNFVVHLLAGLLAYTFQPKKPSLRFVSHELILP